MYTNYFSNKILVHRNIWPEEMDFDFMFNYLFLLKEIFLVVQIALKIDFVVN